MQKNPAEMEFSCVIHTPLEGLVVDRSFYRFRLSSRKSLPDIITGLQISSRLFWNLSVRKKNHEYDV